MLKYLNLSVLFQDYFIIRLFSHHVPHFLNPNDISAQETQISQIGLLEGLGNQ
jgi:hypothetical protein